MPRENPLAEQLNTINRRPTMFASRRRLVALSFALPMAISATGMLHAAERTRIIMPFAAGGATDVLARMVAEQMQRSTGQTVIVENIVGANGNIGAAAAARAAPDGSTAMITSEAYTTVNPAAVQVDVGLRAVGPRGAHLAGGRSRPCSRSRRAGRSRPSPTTSARPRAKESPTRRPASDRRAISPPAISGRWPAASRPRTCRTAAGRRRSTHSSLAM